MVKNEIDGRSVPAMTTHVIPGLTKPVIPGLTSSVIPGLTGYLLAFMLLASCSPKVDWRPVAMDGHRSGVVCLTAENAATGLGTFTDTSYVMPSGAAFAVDSPAGRVASALMGAQAKLAPLKVVVGHSARMMMNDRDNPDLPLGNLFADVLRSYGSKYFGVPMDFAITNFGGIRVPMPEGAVTLEDISSMFPFKNYLCYCKIRGSELQKLFEQLAGTKAFQATSGATVRVKAHKLESVLIGGEPIDPSRVYNVTTIDFLLDGGDNLRIGALSEEVKLTTVLLKDVMLDYVQSCEAERVVIDSASDGRVIMED